jgi:hypothetical protein
MTSLMRQTCFTRGQACQQEAGAAGAASRRLFAAIVEAVRHRRRPGRVQSSWPFLARLENVKNVEQDDDDQGYTKHPEKSGARRNSWGSKPG